MARSPALYRLTWTEVMQPNRALNSHGLPIILHNNPNDTVVNIAPEDLAKLFRVFPNVAAVQGFSAGARRIFSIGKCKDVQPPARTDDLHVENMLASAPGRSAATANPIAKKYVHLTTLTANALLIKSDRCTADFCRFCYDSPPQRVQPDQYGLAQIGRPADVKRPLSKRWTTRGSLSFEALDGFLSHGHDIV
jgi:4-hydroxy-tetrahydrodipicolinate synthase